MALAWIWMRVFNAPFVYTSYPHANTQKMCLKLIVLIVANQDNLLSYAVYPPSDAYVFQYLTNSGSDNGLAQIMACHLLVVKPLSDTRLAWYRLNHLEQISVQFESKYNNFRTRWCILNGSKMADSFDVLPGWNKDVKDAWECEMLVFRYTPVYFLLIFSNRAKATSLFLIDYSWLICGAINITNANSYGWYSLVIQDDVMTWKSFPHYWRKWPMDSLIKGR